MDFVLVLGGGLTTSPTLSSIDDNFDREVQTEVMTEVKTDIPCWKAYSPALPNNALDSLYSMDIDSVSLMHSEPALYGDFMGFNNHQALEQHPFSDNLVSCFNVSPPYYPLQYQRQDDTSLWGNPSENSLAFLDEPDSVLAATTDVFLQDQNKHPLLYPCNNARDHLRMKSAQREPSVVHHVQNRGVSLRGKFEPGAIASIPSAQHKCQMLACASKNAGKKGYKRAEHLKRHIKSRVLLQQSKLQE
ncbi:hypothetical protein BKA67DRAFT_679381 [Truncatella angustata]|uniref:Uncharacterized protein n=1 Tax=Truncatella angustata TaxID=152316 RepID=A0A9P8ZY16_9PEZI|nr:uncharacterized protein BKA67DRAFT_679381 [Truncatella angustata]KAH6653583.1 hypothetical protein BKA67DRAFT_679381 [Truncatella angustata]